MKTRIGWLVPATLALLANLSAKPSSVEPLSLRIAEPAGIFENASVTLKVTMTNESSQELKLVKSSPGCDFQAEVKDDLGRPVELTSLGRELQGCEKRLVMGRRIIVTLRPGESTEDAYPLDLYYEIVKPGRYRLRLNRHVPREAGGGMVKSNEVSFAVDD